MKFKNICDCHNHSNHSYDAKDSMTDMYKRGQELGLLYHAITDHCECDEYYQKVQGYKSVNENSYAEMLIMKEKHSNFLSGIELGQMLCDVEAAKVALSGKNYDVVIGSLHRVSGHEDFYYWSKHKFDPKILLDKYFTELIQMINIGTFDTLAHLTYPCRYMFYSDGTRVNFNPYLDQIAEVYKHLIDKGIALELNTSGLRQDIKEVLPNEGLLKLYKDLGGEYVTLGSDAHCVDDLGKGLQEGLEVLSHIGYKQYTIFKDRKPVMINIE